MLTDQAIVRISKCMIFMRMYTYVPHTNGATTATLIWVFDDFERYIRLFFRMFTWSFACCTWDYQSTRLLQASFALFFFLFLSTSFFFRMSNKKILANKLKLNLSTQAVLPDLEINKRTLTVKRVQCNGFFEINLTSTV